MMTIAEPRQKVRSKMLELTQSPPRRHGILLLTVALALSGAWWRSVLVKDALEIEGGYRLYSAVGQIGIGPGPASVPRTIEWKQETIPTKLRTWFAWPFISRRSVNVPYWCFTVPIAATALLLLTNRPQAPILTSDAVRVRVPWKRRQKKKK